MDLFGKSTDLEGVTKVQDIKYIKLLRMSLRSLFAWPSEADNQDTPTRGDVVGRYFILLVEFACLLPGIAYISDNIGKLSFFELGHSYITVLMNTVAVFRVSLIFTKSYRLVVGIFINKIHLFHFKEKSEYAMKTHLMVHKLSHVFTMCIYVQMSTGIVLFNLIPLFKNLQADAFTNYEFGNVTLQHSVYYYLPFDYKTNYNGYMVVFCFNWFISYICSTCFCTFDLLLSLMVFHVWGHLKILIHDLHSFANKETDSLTTSSTDIKWYSVEDNKQTHRRLRDTVIYHNLIINYLSRMSDAFEYSLFIYLLFHQASGCLLLLECSQLEPESLLQYVPLTLILFEALIQISIIFELLGSMTDKLVDAAYCVPWELMDTSNQKIVHILLKQTQSPLNVKVLDMVEVGCRTMVAILKNSFSYFIMLRTVATED